MLERWICYEPKHRGGCKNGEDYGLGGVWVAWWVLLFRFVPWGSLGWVRHVKAEPIQPGPILSEANNNEVSLWTSIEAELLFSWPLPIWWQTRVSTPAVGEYAARSVYRIWLDYLNRPHWIGVSTSVPAGETNPEKYFRYDQVGDDPIISMGWLIRSPAPWGAVVAWEESFVQHHQFFKWDKSWEQCFCVPTLYVGQGLPDGSIK